METNNGQYYARLIVFYWDTNEQRFVISQPITKQRTFDHHIGEAKRSIAVMLREAIADIEVATGDYPLWKIVCVYGNLNKLVEHIDKTVILDYGDMEE